MAEIRFKAFVDDVVRDQSGTVFVLKTSEQHRRKDGDTWVTTARTYRDVKVSRDSGVNLDGFGKGDRVEVAGTEKTEPRKGADKTFYTLVVWADAVTRDGQVAEPAAQPEYAWPADGGEPF
jgi:hypothetical protein